MDAGSEARQEIQPSSASSWRWTAATGTWVVSVGAVLTGIAPFFTWVHVVLLGDLNLFNLASASHASPLEAWAAPILAAIALFLLLRSKATIESIGVAFGLLIGLYDGLLLWSLARDVNATLGFAQLGSGPWIGLLGAAAMVVGGLKRPHDSSESPAEEVTAQAEQISDAPAGEAHTPQRRCVDEPH